MKRRRGGEEERRRGGEEDWRRGGEEERRRGGEEERRRGGEESSINKKRTGRVGDLSLLFSSCSSVSV
jgi:X-linked retinitis pigmentosa GTPase regulator